jgi:hypothetical protein
MADDDKDKDKPATPDPALGAPGTGDKPAIGSERYQEEISDAVAEAVDRDMTTTVPGGKYIVGFDDPRRRRGPIYSDAHGKVIS